MSRTAASARPRGHTVRLALLAMLVGLLGTFAVTHVLGRPPGTVAASTGVTYLPPGGHQPQAAPDFTLKDQAGQTVSLSGLKGHEVLVTFLDPQCTTLCPLTAQEISVAEGRLPAGVTPTLLVVSAASNRSPHDVATFVSRFHWRRGWHWLLGDQAQLQAVWATWSLAFGGATLPDQEIVYVVDRGGRIVASFDTPAPPALLATTVTIHWPH